MKSVKLLKEIIKDLELAVRDAEKADKGNVSAGIRLRKDAMQASKDLGDLRSLVLESRKEKD